MTKSPASAKPALWPRVFTGVLMLAVIVLGILMLPRGFSENLSAIGQGKPVAVHVYDKESVASIDLMDILGKLRGEYEDRVTLVVADLNHERGAYFAEQQNLGAGDLVLFDAAGRRVAVINPPHQLEKVRRALDELVGGKQ